MAKEEGDTFDDKVSKNVGAQDTESLAQLLAQEKEKAEKYLINWQRTEADFRNYKAREEQGKKDLVNWANSTLVCDILPVLDAFDRAFEGVTLQGKELSWITGFKQIQKMILDVLGKHGLTEMKCVGEIFDPSRHEAVAQQEGAEGMILGEVQKGYMMKDKLLRASQVVVGSSGEKPNPEPAKAIEENLTNETGA
ncbi:MAG: nucleotide exchange factor GrpE [Dehalococcoidia bacterium]|nr:nucleotide exchange factor GrpE [Dehalococcoidia bacterium]